MKALFDAQHAGANARGGAGLILERIEVEGLAHYSYVVGCESARDIVVVDPERNVDRYLDLAHQRGWRIRAVVETHIHADYASGSRELAERAGAELALSAYDHGEQYVVAFPHRALRDGDRIVAGMVVLQARHTPGHTPEHVSYLIYDGARSEQVPVVMLSGDFLFVGSVGRPDLLGAAATHSLAEQLYSSVAALADLPDGLEIHPGHGAGSMCGSGMSGRPVSTLGYERIANPFLERGLTREEFVSRLLATRPPLPPYYLRMKTLNSQGPARLSSLPLPAALDVEAFARARERGVVVDVRDPLSFAAGHIPGSLSIGAGASLATWASWVVPYDRPILLVAPSDDVALAAIHALRRVGLDAAEGVLAGGFDSWKQSGQPVRKTEQLAPRDLERALTAGSLAGLVDVRSENEFSAGHIHGALHLMGGFLSDHLEEVPRSGPVAIVCQSGYRSTVASSVLERAGFEHILNVTGGMNAWQQQGLPVDRGAEK
jgi:hydroxyacylglutathione hydrolase